MSLRAGQQRALNRIEQTLQAEDSRLGSLFTTFTRLTHHEAMPWTERITAGRWRRLRHALAFAVSRLPARRRSQARRATAV
jgi:hypothetical protein